MSAAVSAANSSPTARVPPRLPARRHAAVVAAAARGAAAGFMALMRGGLLKRSRRLAKAAAQTMWAAAVSAEADRVEEKRALQLRRPPPAIAGWGLEGLAHTIELRAGALVRGSDGRLRLALPAGPPGALRPPAAALRRSAAAATTTTITTFGGGRTGARACGRASCAVWGEARGCWGRC